MKEKIDKSEEYTGDILQNQFTAYVEKALKNNRISYHRKQQAKQKDILFYASEEDIPVHIHESSTDADADDDISNFRNQTLLGAIGLLTENDVTIIRLHVLYGYSFKTISFLLGIPSDTANKRYQRAITKLRKRLEGGK